MPEDVEVFESLADAQQACNDRYWDRYRSSGPNGLGTPAVDGTSGMRVWFSDPRGKYDPYPDRRIVRVRGWFRLMPA